MRSSFSIQASPLFLCSNPEPFQLPNYTQKNRGVGRNLLNYLQEHNQDVPQKLRDIVTSAPVMTRGKGGKGRKGGQGDKDADCNTVSSGRTVSRKQMLQEKAVQEASSYNAGNMYAAHSLVKKIRNDVYTFRSTKASANIEYIPY